MVKKSLINNQQGLVSITVALIMMIIITLLIFSFALVARREQRLALDRRLSSQAYYAAESGINKARYEINNNTISSNVTTCTPVDINAATSVQTTCALVDLTPNSLAFDGVTTDKSKVIKLSAINSSGTATNIRRIEFYWNSSSQPTSFSSRNNGVFPTTATFSVLRVSLTKLTLPIPFNRDNLNNNTYHAFLYPKTSSVLPTDAIFNNDAQQGVVVQGYCATTNSPKYCKAVINIPSGTNESNFLLKLSSIYTNANVAIYAYDTASTGGNQLAFRGSQAVVDATGRAQDVLRRIQARVPLDNSWTSEAWSVTANRICKVYNVSSSTTSDNETDCPRID